MVNQSINRHPLIGVNHDVVKKDDPMKMNIAFQNGPIPLASIVKAAAVATVVAVAGSGVAIAGADATFNTALTSFTGFLEGSGGKIITVLSLAGGIVGLASGRFCGRSLSGVRFLEGGGAIWLINTLFQHGSTIRN